MPLTEHEKSEARDALALELNEPEAMIEYLQRLCARKAKAELISDNERERWQNAHNALSNVAQELELANAPHKRQVDATSAQGETQSGC